MRRSKSVASLVLAVGVGALMVLWAGLSHADAGSKASAAGKMMEKIFGQIDSVSVDSKLLTIKEKDKEVQVIWTDATKVAWKSGKAKPEATTAADLKAGEHVSVRAEKTADGKLDATSIWIYKPMEHAPKAESAK